MQSPPEACNIPHTGDESSPLEHYAAPPSVLLGRAGHELEMHAHAHKFPDCQKEIHSNAKDDHDGSLCIRALSEAFKVKEDVVNVDGNIYRYWSFKKFGSKKVNGVSLFAVPQSRLSGLIHSLGLFCVLVIQCIGPISILLVQISTVKLDFRGWEKYVEITWQQWFVVILSWCFLFCFILNAIYSVDSDMRSSAQCYKIAKGLALIEEPVRSIWLVVDAIVNCQLAVICSVAMFSLMMDQSTAQDVMLDALGIAFLLKIDDVNSELGFLGRVWDPLKVGTFYKQLQDARVFEHINAVDAQVEADEETANAEDEDIRHEEIRQRAGHRQRPVKKSLFRSAAVKLKFATIKANKILTWQIFWWTRLILCVLLILAIPAPALLVSAAVGKNDEKGDTLF
jgi:hypothetical protein